MSLEDIERRLKALEDVEEIKRLKARYCAYCDDNYDADAIASLFTEMLSGTAGYGAGPTAEKRSAISSLERPKGCPSRYTWS